MAEDDPAKKQSWDTFFDLTAEVEPSRTLARVIERYKKSGTALDLGSGGGKDTRFLADNGFVVTAVDAEQAAKGFIQKYILEDKASFICSKFETLELSKEHYDLINAQFSLPFTGPEKFNEVFTKVKQALKPNGVFVGNFFGNKDEWNKPGSECAYQTESQAKELLQDLKIIRFFEVDDLNGQTANGQPKHWHYFNIIARKPE